MKNQSRVSNSYKNAKVALLFYLLNLLLQFVYRKVFISYIGVDFLGLNTTATNLLQFLNIAELGVGAAVSYALYKPLNERDNVRVNEILSVQAYLYRNIGLIILCVGFILMFFFPFFFKEIKIPIWYTYATFSVLLFSSLLSFFFNYDQILLISDQKEYKVNYIVQGIKIIKLLAQIILIYILTHGYIWWLVVELLAGAFTCIGLKYIVSKEYILLSSNAKSGKILLHKYAEIITKTKQLFSHKIAAFALNQSSPLIIFAYSSLAFVAVYGNYLLIIAGITALLGAVFNSTNAGIGNLIAEGNKQKILSVFDELFSIRFFFASIASITVYKLTPFFITYWVGKSFILDETTLILMVVIMFINLTRLTVDSFISGFGLFNDTAAPIIETVLNLGLSILLGSFLGTNGVLIGVIISLLVVVNGWKPYFLFGSGFNFNYMHYLKLYGKNLILVISCFLLLNVLMNYVKIDPSKSIFNFLIYSSILTVSFTFFLFVGYIILVKEMKFFLLRIFNYIKTK